MQVHRFLQITSGKFSGFGTEPCLGEFGEWVAVVIGLHLFLGQRETIGPLSWCFHSEYYCVWSKGIMLQNVKMKVRFPWQ